MGFVFIYYDSEFCGKIFGETKVGAEFWELGTVTRGVSIKYIEPGFGDIGAQQDWKSIEGTRPSGSTRLAYWAWQGWPGGQIELVLELNFVNSDFTNLSNSYLAYSDKNRVHL